ncbi:MAG: NADH-quinone oxidoreductase subunit B 2 [Parcubacteria group bacterium GW2011_GWA2_47_10]|nr:MAG: NADH-quinone oxidoreductase subunit B 2 [Parcubacteria group bacterium GW2011_GWA2_47_10]OGZ99225.1 MAG: hypothetical protein A3D57_05590 [Candidatus Sungbacteria bacterium RIFCSPHIGHO2_02_FULL_46_12]
MFDIVLAKTSELFVAVTEPGFRWARGNSLWPVVFGISCCSLEMMDLGASRTDVDRIGTFFRATPRQCDVLIVPGGPVTLKMSHVVQRLYAEMARPRYVIGLGACTISGGLFRGSYNLIDRLDSIVPVDVYVPGCPPRPEAMMDGVLQLKKLIETKQI